MSDYNKNICARCGGDHMTRDCPTLREESSLAAMPGSATATRYEMELTNMARERLTKHPHCQADAIAKHYAAHATIALQLLKMLECRQHTETWPELERGIKMLVDEIKTNHRHDFGIELEWPNTERSDAPSIR